MTRHTSFRTKRQGFTLIEILVVLAIVGIVSSITLGGFKEMAAGSKRLSCQTNLTQIYQASRLYAADEGGKFPYYSFDTLNNCNTPAQGTGLWMLYTFPKSNDYNAIAAQSENKPIERYLRSSKVLHCPADIAPANQNLFDPANSGNYNKDYLSYQSCDSGIPTYTTNRTINTGNASLWKRQLIHRDSSGFVPRQPTGDTIVTWCKWHRPEGKRDLDNVLFYDGSVQLLPQGDAGDARWQRQPKAPQ